MSAIDLDRVTIRLHDRTVLTDMSLSIAEGEFIGVLGPNGSGKTTLIKTLLGLVIPIHGTVRVLESSPRRGNAQIGYVPQVRALLSDLRMRGLDLVASSLRGERWGLPIVGRGDRRIVEDALAAVGVSELANRPLYEMSGGERQRLLLAQALIGSPRLLLLDEPLIGLDPRHQKNVIDHVRQFARDHRVTVLFSAHELNQLLGALDRVLYLGHGHAALGTVDEVVTAPVLSRLYDAEVEVIRASGHIFVMSKGGNLERTEHLHEHLRSAAHQHSAHEHSHDA